MIFLMQLFKGLLLITGILILLIIIYAIVTEPIRQRNKKEKAQMILGELNKITEEAIEELLKENKKNNTKKKNEKKEKK